MDINGHVSTQGEALEEFRVQIEKKMVPTNVVHIVVGPGRGTWDRTNQNIIDKIQDPTSHQVLGRRKNFVKKV